MNNSGWHPVADPNVVEFFVEITPTWLGHLLVFLTYLGSVFVVVPLAVVAYWSDPERFAPWIPAVVGYYGLMTAIKSLNGATRPVVDAPVGPDHAPALFAGTYDHATAIATTSFPSGNVIAATVIAGLFVADSKLWTPRKRLGIAGAMVVTVSYTRLGLGVHYPVDVVGGVLIGLGFLGIVTLIRRRASDETAALFALAAILTLVALWFRLGFTLPPETAALTGSNRPVAFGAAVGGLLVWRTIRSRSQPDGRRAVAASVLAIGLTLVGGYLLLSVLVDPVGVTVGAAVTFGAAVATPWTIPARAGIFSWIGLGGRRRGSSAWRTDESESL